MTVIVGQKHKTVLDPDRVIQCGNCRTPSTIEEAESNPVCPRCKQTRCVFCGCTERAPCLDLGRGCSWIHPVLAATHELPEALCTVCYRQVAEALYLMVTGREDQVPAFVEPTRSQVI